MRNWRSITHVQESQVLGAHASRCSGPFACLRRNHPPGISFASSSETSCMDTHTNLSSARRLAIDQRSMHGDPHQKPNRLHNAPANFSDFARGKIKDLQEIKWLTMSRRRRFSRCKKPVCVSSFSTWFSCYFHATTTTTIKKILSLINWISRVPLTRAPLKNRVGASSFSR
jgi:hypothetical protein